MGTEPPAALAQRSDTLSTRSFQEGKEQEYLGSEQKQLFGAWFLAVRCEAGRLQKIADPTT